MDVVEETGVKPVNGRLNIYTSALAVIASTNSILLGYDIGVMSGAKIFIQEDLQISSKKINFLVGALNVFSIFGSLAAGKTSDMIGRRYTIVLAAFTFLCGALLMGLATNYTFLMAGRIIAGIGVGYTLMIAPVYTAEIAPASARGFLGSLPEVFITFGIVIGFIINYVLRDLPININWRVMLGLAAIPAVGVMIGVLFMPESPRWLVMKGREEEARRVLINTSKEGEVEAKKRLEEIMSASAEATANAKGVSVWRELVIQPSRAVRRMLIASIGLNIFMQACGNDAVVYYTPEVFKAAGVRKKSHQFLVNVVMGFSKSLACLISALFFDRFGRRPLLFISTVGMVLSLTGLGLGSMYLSRSVEKPAWAMGLSIVAVCTDVSFFSIGLGPITWLYSSEIFPLRLRAQGSAIAFTVNRLVSGVVTICFPMVAQSITFAGTFFVFAVMAFMCLIFVYVFLPETKGKNLEDIEELFDSRRGSVAESTEMDGK